MAFILSSFAQAFEEVDKQDMELSLKSKDAIVIGVKTSSKIPKATYFRYFSKFSDISLNEIESSFDEYSKKNKNKILILKTLKGSSKVSYELEIDPIDDHLNIEVNDEPHLFFVDRVDGRLMYDNCGYVKVNESDIINIDRDNINDYISSFIKNNSFECIREVEVKD